MWKKILVGRNDFKYRLWSQFNLDSKLDQSISSHASWAKYFSDNFIFYKMEIIGLLIGWF